MFTDFELKIAQKMSLDIRYFCHEKPKKGFLCKNSVTELPTLLADMLSETNVSGVVLFAENLESTSQIIKLTAALQQSAMASPSAKPMIISIDQEGGRVARLPEGTPFAGNMALGATYNTYDTKYAAVVSRVIAKELVALGFNNNYAPVIDVNTNPDNPVINTRSFGQNPIKVAKLGVAVVNGLQQQGIMATLKHFPGHGDTNVDSHLGLPIVDHDLATIKKNDLLPFQYAIEHSDPAMIMTAHIQYPVLDSSTFTNTAGDKMIRPATMSRKILTGLLRNEMGYKGIIATDALDMAGIAHFFDPVTATVETFLAGSDLALMPFTIRVPSDIVKFKLFIKEVSAVLEEKINQNKFSLDEVNASIDRINFYKDKYAPFNSEILSISEDKIAVANEIIHSEKHKALQQIIADKSATLLKNEDNLLPLQTDKIKHIKLLVIDEVEKQAVELAISEGLKRVTQQSSMMKKIPTIKITPVVATSIQPKEEAGSVDAQNEDVDVVIALIDVKIVSIVDMGATSDFVPLSKKEQNKSVNTITFKELVMRELLTAKTHGAKTLVIAKGSPYLVQPYLQNADASILIYDDKAFKNEQNKYESAGINASIGIIFGLLKAQGVLPVELK